MFVNLPEIRKCGTALRSVEQHSYSVEQGRSFGKIFKNSKYTRHILKQYIESSENSQRLFVLALFRSYY